MNKKTPTIGKKDLEDIQLATAGSFWHKLQMLYGKSGSEALGKMLEAMEKKDERVAFKNFQEAFVGSLDGFEFDAMLMYGWAADADFKVRAKDVSYSLMAWINKYKKEKGKARPELVSVAEKLANKEPVDLAEFINALVKNDNAMLSCDHSSVGELIKDRLEDMAGDLKFIFRDFDATNDICGFNIRRTYKVINMYKPLCGLRIVKPFGIKLNNSDRTDRVDLVSVLLIDNDRNVIGYQGQFQEAWTRVKAVARVEQKATMAAIMARNMSHNIGSHVLADFSRKTEDYPEETVKNFIQYIQERMDFIAGITSGWSGTLESIWFFTELLNNLLENEPLVDLLVRSHGYNLDNIVFEVNHQYVAKYNYKDRGKQFRWYEKGTDRQVAPDDFLVAIPGGGCGRHAFFTIIENIIRNSAKYNPQQEQLIFYINIKPGKLDAYMLEVFDNLSKITVNNDLDAQVKRKFNQEFVEIKENSVEANMENMGLAEMRLASKYLSEPKSKHLSVHNEKVDQDQEQIAKAFHIWPFRVTLNRETFLSYRFHLQRPQNLLILNDKLPQVSIPDGLGIVQRDKVDMLHAANESFFITLVKTDDQLATIERRFRPSRIVAMDLPSHLHSDSSIEAWEAFQTRVFKEWLTSRFADDMKKYHLFLSLSGPDRLKTAQKWLVKELDHQLFEFHVLLTQGYPARIHSVVYSTRFKRPEDVVAFLEDAPPDSVILYDNHGDVEHLMKSRGCGDGACFIQQSGSNNLKIFNLLCSPPQDEHLKAQLIYSLFEAALTRVLVVDERIAESFLIHDEKAVEPSDLKDLYQLHNDMNLCIPAFIWVQDDKEPKFLSVRLRDAFERNPEGLLGVHVTLDGLRVYRCERDGRRTECFHQKHIIVMHQGIIDCFLSDYLTSGDWLTHAAYQSASHFVITSGRGRITRHIDEGAPFLDFSTLKDHLVNNQSKYHLVKSLQASKGGIK